MLCVINNQKTNPITCHQQHQKVKILLVNLEKPTKKPYSNLAHLSIFIQEELNLQCCILKYSWPNETVESTEKDSNSRKIMKLDLV